MVGCHFVSTKVAVLLFQKVQKEYKKEGWTKHHEQLLEFEEPEDGSEKSITLSVEQSLQDGKWEITPVTPNLVRNFSPRMRIYLLSLPSLLIHCLHGCNRSLNRRWMIAC